MMFLSVVNLACSPQQPSQQKGLVPVLALPVSQGSDLIDPLLVSSSGKALLNDLVFDGLVGWDEHIEIIPRLASSWMLSDDGRVWTFYLRQGVRFHDGTEMTAEDVEFTLAHAMRVPNPFLYSFQMIEQIDVIDEYTISVRLKQPLASFLGALEVGILPSHLLRANNNDPTLEFDTMPIGTGRYMIKEMGAQEMTLIANGNHFLGEPPLRHIDVKVLPTLEMAWSELIKGSVEIFPYIGPQDFERMRQIPAIRVYSTLKPYYYLLALNLESPLFENKTVRQALNYAVNKEEIVSKVLKEQGQVASGTIYPGSWAYNSSVHPYVYRPEKAVALLQEAGWQDSDSDHFLEKDGKRFEFTAYSNRGDDLKRRVLLMIEQQLLDIGIKMKIEFFDAADTDFLFQKRFSAHFPEIEADGDPDLSYKYWHSSQIENGFNVSSYRNAKVDQLLEDGRRTFDQAQRKKIYNEFQKELLDDPPGIFLFWTNYLVGVSERIKGVKISPAGPFANIHEWYVD